MTVYPSDKALEEIEDVSRQSQIPLWPCQTLDLVGTGTVIVIGVLKKLESRYWLELGKQVEPRAEPDDNLFLTLEDLYQARAAPFEQTKMVGYYDLSSSAWSTVTALTSDIAIAANYRLHVHPHDVIFIKQPVGSFSGLRQEANEINLPSAGYTFFGDFATIYSRERTLEVAGLSVITNALSQLRIPFEVDKEVLPLLNESTTQAVTVATGILVDEVSRGLPVKHITIEPLIDRDAGQWSEVVFTIQVDLDSDDANRSWDSILTQISELADMQTDNEVAIALLERIGIHLTWVTPDNV